MVDADVPWLMQPRLHDLAPSEALVELCRRPAWHRRAACRGMGTDLFFPRTGRSMAAAKAVCAGCQVRGECLEAAEAAGAELQGVWGGLTDRERRRRRLRAVGVAS